MVKPEPGSRTISGDFSPLFWIMGIPCVLLLLSIPTVPHSIPAQLGRGLGLIVPALALYRYVHVQYLHVRPAPLHQRQ